MAESRATTESPSAAPIDKERHQRLVEDRRATRERDLLAPGSRTEPHFTRVGHRPRYFPIDVAYRVPVTLEPAGPGTRTTRERVTGEAEDVAVIGILHGSLSGQPFALEAARTPDGQIRADFRDATSGNESYGFRFLPVEPDARGDWWIDFNLAQNPLCAYGDGFRCLLPSPQNTLTLPIRAGERRFH